MANPPFLTVKQAAARLIVNKKTLIEWERVGKIPKARRYRADQHTGVFSETTRDPDLQDWRGYSEEDVETIFDMMAKGLKPNTDSPRPSSLGNGFLSARQIHLRHGVHWASIARMAREGRMPSGQMTGGGRVWPVHEIEHWLFWTNHEEYKRHRMAPWTTAILIMQKSNNPFELAQAA
jgi:predicted DNA-binding transcriptional regulator AlpA